MSLRLVAQLMVGQSVIDSFTRGPTRWGLSACAGGAATAASIKVLSVLGIYSGGAAQLLIGAGTLVAILGAGVMVSSLLHARLQRRSLHSGFTLQAEAISDKSVLETSNQNATTSMIEITEPTTSEFKIESRFSGEKNPQPPVG